MMNNQVFSEYEVKETSIKFQGDTKSNRAGCVGSLEETLDSKVIVKKCEGIESVVAVKGTGKGELKISIHMPYEMYNEIYGMNLDSLIKGVVGYGQQSIHNKFCLTNKVYDENNDCKLKAYPNCIMKEGISRKIENGSEEIAEIELTIAVNPDENGMGMYEALISNLEKETAEKLIEDWMTNFTTDLVQVVQA